MTEEYVLPLFTSHFRHKEKSVGNRLIYFLQTSSPPGAKQFNAQNNLFCSALGICIILFSIGSIIPANGQVNSLLKDGNRSYKKEKYNEAEKLYSDALSKDQDSYNSNFNLGDALYQQKKYKEAAGFYERSAELGKVKSQKEQSYYNLGNSYLKQDQIEESISAYKNALKLNPDDLYAKFNLSYAIQKRREKEKQQSKNSQAQSKQQQNKNNKDQQNNSEKNDQQKQSIVKTQPQKNPNEISDAEAEQIMDALKNNEQKIRQRMYDRQRQDERSKTDKPW